MWNVRKADICIKTKALIELHFSDTDS